MAMMESWYKQDLKKPVQVHGITGNLFSQDNQANLIGVEVFDDGQAATLAGTVSANIIRADGGTVTATGTYSENKASVVLPAAAYAVPGMATVVLKITDSGVVTTLLAVVVNIYRSSTDTAIDPGTIIPSIQTLISQIETAVASIPADYSSLWTTLAPAYTSLTFPVKAGQYCTNGGVFYRAKQDIPTSETFTSSHWESVVVGNELSSLKSALKIIPITQRKKAVTFENQTVNVNSFVTASNYNCYVVPCVEGDKFTVSCFGATNYKAYGFIGSNGEKLLVSPNGYNAKGAVLTAPTGSAYLVINDKGGYTSYYGDVNLYLEGKGILDGTDASAGITLDMLTNGVWQVGYAFFAGDRATPPTTDTKSPKQFVHRAEGFHLIACNFGNTGKVQIALAYGDNNAFIRRMLSGSWTAWTAFSGLASSEIGDISDFNDLILPGYYLLSSEKMGSMANGNGVTGSAMCVVFAQYSTETSSMYVEQMLFTVVGGTMFIRHKYLSGSTPWSNWASVGTSYNPFPSGTSDLDGITQTGFYYLNTNDVRNFSNVPCKYASPMLVFSPGNQSDIVSQIIFDTREGKIYARKILGSAWTDWCVIASSTNGMVWAYDFDDSQFVFDDTWEDEWETQQSPQSPGRPNLITSNTGIDLKVATYNLYDYGLYTSWLWNKPEKLLKLRKWIAAGDFDIILTQEDQTWIDGPDDNTPNKGTRSASKYLFYDRLPSRSLSFSNTRIRSKRPVTISYGVKVQTIMADVKKADGSAYGTVGDRNLVWGVIPVQGKNVLAISCHPRNSYSYYFDSNPTYGPVADRMNFMQIVFDLVYCLKHTEIYHDSAPEITAPWDYVIIGGDLNTSNINGRSTATGHALYEGDDFTNICTLRDYYGFDSANGGYLNWFVTHQQNGGSSLDNILVSGNVSLNSIKSEYQYFEELYSDHIPVETTMTLLSQDDNPGKDLLRFPSVTYEGKNVTDDLTDLKTWFAQIMTGSIQYPCL